MTRLILFNKPYQVLSQFTDDSGRGTLADYLDAPGFRPAGRLDYDSEGLLLLTDNGSLQQLIANPRHKAWKTYWVQVEGVPDAEAVTVMAGGVKLRDGPTLPARVGRMGVPELWERQPPIRVRESIPDSWLSLSIREGRNRQVRRMTAAVGHPTLRLVRYAIGDWNLDGLAPGKWRSVEVPTPRPRTAAKRQQTKPVRPGSKGKTTHQRRRRD